MFGLGPTEMLIVGAIAVILFGNKLPELARSLGGSYREFRKGLTDIQSQMNVSSVDYRSSSKAPASSYAANDDYDDYQAPTAPKFDPPPAEPQQS